MGGYHSNQRRASNLDDVAAATAASDSGASVPRPERRVLIAVDGSKGAQRAFDYWSGVPGSQNDSIILLHSLEAPNVLTGLLLSPSGTFDYEEYEKQGRLLKQRSQQLGQELLAQCEKRRLHCKFVSDAGSPGTAIVEAARNYAANVVVVGCRGNNGIRRTILGSVSDYVLQHSCRPVIVVPEVGTDK